MRKVCKTCKVFVKGPECHICHQKNFVTSWKGRIAIIDKDKSEIAQKLEIKNNGEYAIKVS